MNWLTEDEINDFEAPSSFLAELADLIAVGELKLTETALATILEFVGE